MHLFECYCDVQTVRLIKYRTLTEVNSAVRAINYGLAPLVKLRTQTEEGKHKIKQENIYTYLIEKINLGNFSEFVVWLAVLQVCSL